LLGQKSIVLRGGTIGDKASTIWSGLLFKRAGITACLEPRLRLRTEVYFFKMATLDEFASKKCLLKTIKRYVKITPVSYLEELNQVACLLDSWMGRP